MGKAEVMDKQSNISGNIVNGASLFDGVFNSKKSIMDDYLQSFEAAKHKNIDVT